MNVKIGYMVLTLLFFALCQNMIIAGTTGKLAGTLTDASTNEPVIGANITLKGSLIGASSDFEGAYAILNIPPGTYSVVVSILGYQQIQFDNIDISVDLTTTLDAKLQQTAIEIGTQIITAERQLVVKDMTSSMTTVGSREIRSLPVQQIQQVLRLSAGIVEADGQLHIRGGRAGEVAYWVDGISATDLYDGRIGVSVENSAVQELQVISGTFNAEYGQAMSGIVNVITKEGNENYTGQLKVYAGDYMSSADEFGIYKKVDTDPNPINRLEMIDQDSTERENPLKKLNPIYNVEFSLGGPIPLLGSNNLTFFANGRYFYDEGYYYGRNWFKPSGVPGDSSLVALNPNETNSLLAKLNFKLNSNIKLGYNVFWNTSKRDRNYFRANSIDYQFNTSGQANFNQFNSHDFKYVPYAIPKYSGSGLTNTITLNHILSPTTFYELRGSRYYSESKQYVYENPLQAIHYISTVDSATGTVTYSADPNGPDGYIAPKEISAPSSNSFMNKGMDITHTERSSSYLIGKLDLTSQLNKANQLKVGTELRLHELTLHSFQIMAMSAVNGEDSIPFQPMIPDIGSINRNDYTRNPREASFYVQDKVEFKDIIINVGLRYDYFDANGVILRDPTDPNIYSPFKYGHVYKGVPDSLKDLTKGYDSFIESLKAAGTIQEYTIDERKSLMHKKVDAKMAVSPRLGVSFPITDRGVIHFSYGHFLQIPEFQYLYTNPDYKITSGSGNSIFGNPDLEPQKTVQYEIGLQQQLTDVIGVDVSMFYRDVRDWVGTSRLFTTAQNTVKYSKYENKDYSNVKGVTLKIEKRYADNYSFRADYTLQFAEGTYTNPTDELNATLQNQQPALALIPLGFDRRHTLNGQFIYTVTGWTFSLIGRYFTGQPYTPSFTINEAVGASGVSGLQNNSARRPDQKSVDLTINKRFSLASDFALELFINVYNLFDQRDQTNVYGDTGTADYTTNADPNRVEYQAARVSTIEDFVNQPSWYSAPRQIQAGIILGF